MERRFRSIDLVSLLFGAVCMLETIVGLVVQRAYGFLLRDFAFELPLAMRFMLEPMTLLAGPVAFVVVIEGVWRKSSEAGQVVRCLVAVVAAVGLLIGLAATMNVLRSINPQKTETTAAASRKIKWCGSIGSTRSRPGPTQVEGATRRSSCAPGSPPNLRLSRSWEWHGEECGTEGAGA